MTEKPESVSVESIFFKLGELRDHPQSISFNNFWFKILITLFFVGGFSYFQLWAGLVLLAPEIPAAMIAMLPVFIGGTVHGDMNPKWSNSNSKCGQILGNDSQNEASEFSYFHCTSVVDEV